MANIYDLQRYGKVAFMIAAVAVVATFLYFSNGLIRDLSIQERERMELWAEATKEIVASLNMTDEDLADGKGTNIDFMLHVIEGNTTIPVMLTDEEGNILQYRNFELPVPIDTITYSNVDDPQNQAFLQKKLRQLSQTSNVIEIEISEDVSQYLYYEDSTLLKRLSLYPYILIAVMLAFITVVYFAVVSTKKAEQNKVWVGLTKETAHQLGTPISSLLAWMELLPDMGVDSDTVAEMNKDVSRLSTIASRFSKIGSEPKMERTELADIVEAAVGYMSTRISPRINLTCNIHCRGALIEASAPLLEWVIENLVKNAVDAMEGSGKIDVTAAVDGEESVYVDITDTGKGISRKNFKTVFNPGFTTKSRGWGLGLTLAKRIIEQYHHGRIYVKQSTPGQGTTFRIEFRTITSE